MSRAIVLVLDSLGVGAAPDAASFGDQQSNTFGHIAQWCAAQGQPLQLPNLTALGLGHAVQVATGQWPQGLAQPTHVRAHYAACAERSRGKDTPSGHWELMGAPVDFDWGYFNQPDAQGSVFPDDLMREWMNAAGLSATLGNCHASGTEIIERLGDEHVRTGAPICYTSADSVFQIAVHETHFGLERLYAICELAKPIFDRAHIARVIARPFLGEAGRYRRTGHRRDYTTPPTGVTLLDLLVSAGRQVHAVGKISDIFAHRGITHSIKADGNAALCRATLEALKGCPQGSMVFTNLVDFDMLYGHRRDTAGYAHALQELDAWLPQLQAQMQAGDVLVITADHGCDPTAPGSDHTRECVPWLWHEAGQTAGQSMGLRSSFADVGQSLATWLKLPALAAGVLPDAIKIRFM